MNGLWWLPEEPGWKARLKDCKDNPSWSRLVSLANARLDFLQTMQLDRLLGSFSAGEKPRDCQFAPIRLAILSSCTVEHLLPGLRVAALRRGLWLTTYVCDYGQYQQNLLDAGSPLHRFKPTVVLFSFDPAHLLGDRIAEGEPGIVVDAALDRIGQSWNLARDHFQCQVIQQTLLPTFEPVVGENEQRLGGSPKALAAQFNARVRDRADAGNVDILALDEHAARNGIDYWHSPSLWHRAKQDVSPAAAPLYADIVLRLAAARLGRSAKCLVLDLDNTLWGGVIGDDGLEGIVLGQGSAEGEAHLGFQRYARNLSQRGVILAVCSKNDEKIALEPFQSHPEMLLKPGDIACFVANWDDKATNLRNIAHQLNIGLDSLVFADDNAFERNIVRRELPMVMVPELPEDPALYARCIADAGYFETLEVTREDVQRTQNYQSEKARAQLRQSVTDMDGYLKSLEMQLIWSSFDRTGLQRIVQLINKTNQFNLTTRRYSEAEVSKLLDDPQALTLQLRLTDKFGDHGVIGIVIALQAADGELAIDTWLMSCRVLGRGVESATLNLLVQEAAKRGASALSGRYLRTEKNGMVKDHYAKLGFHSLSTNADESETAWHLKLADHAPPTSFIHTIQG